MHRRIAIRKIVIFFKNFYCKEKFFDSQYKEWFERLEYDGTVKNSAKGTPWKCAFHLVRALVFTLEAFSEMEAV